MSDSKSIVPFVDTAKALKRTYDRVQDLATSIEKADPQGVLDAVDAIVPTASTSFEATPKRPRVSTPPPVYTVRKPVARVAVLPEHIPHYPFSPYASWRDRTMYAVAALRSRRRGRRRGLRYV